MIDIVVITNKSAEQIKTLATLHCPFPHKLVLCRAFGFGTARNTGALGLDNNLVVQLNDDLVLSPMLWQFAMTINDGEFAFQVVTNNKGEGQPCSRVFIIHKKDYWRVGGCDNSLKYFFEDGDFYDRAIAAGLKFKAAPDSLAVHIPHVHAFYNPPMAKLARIESEVCRVFVKHKRKVTSDFVGFFVPFRDYRVVLQHFILRVLFMVYWIIRDVD